MIADPKSTSDGRALKWAADQLGVPLESPPDVCTAAFLRRLAEEDFVPPPRLRKAWEFASGGSSEGRPALPWLDSATETELSDRIEEFAGQFFNLPPEQRSAQWERLYADARRWPRLETRLTRLRPGLTVEFAALPALSRQEARLIEWIRELFTLPQEERAVRRRQILREGLGSEVRPWQKAAQQLRRQQRAIAALAPDLLLPLAIWSRSVKWVSQNRRFRTWAAVSSLAVRSVRKKFKSAARLCFALVVGCILASQANKWQQESRYTPQFDPPQIVQPDSSYPNVNKGLEKALEILKKNGQLPKPAPVPPTESPMLNLLVPSLPHKPPDTTRDNNLLELLLPQNEPPGAPSPVAPAGPNR